MDIGNLDIRPPCQLDRIFMDINNLDTRPSVR